MRWGHDFLRIWVGGDIQTFGANGEMPNVKGKTHQTINYLSCLTHPIIYYCHKLVELDIAWDGKCMTTQIQIGEAISFWETRFDSLSKQKPKNIGHSTMLSGFFMFSSPSFLHVSSLRHLELPVCVFLPLFWLLA